MRNIYPVMLDNDIVGFIETDKSFIEVNDTYYKILEEEFNDEFDPEIFELMESDYDMKYINFEDTGDILYIY